MNNAVNQGNKPIRRRKWGILVKRFISKLYFGFKQFIIYTFLCVYRPLNLENSDNLTLLHVRQKLSTMDFNKEIRENQHNIGKSNQYRNAVNILS